MSENIWDVVDRLTRRVEALEGLRKATKNRRAATRRATPHGKGHHFEIYKDKSGEYRARFKYNSEVMFSTKGYSSKDSAKNAIASIQKNSPIADTEDNS